MTSDRPVIVWFRQDLRVADQHALAAAAGAGRSVIPLYVLDDETPGVWRMGGAARWWLHGSLQSLAKDLTRLGVALVLRRGPARRTVVDFAREVQASAVYCTRHVEPWWRAVDCELDSELPRSGIEFRQFPGGTLYEPGTVGVRHGRLLRVFTPFWRDCRAASPPAAPIAAPKRLKRTSTVLRSDDLGSWRLLPSKPDWAGGLRENWRPGEAGARQRLADFVDHNLQSYHLDRDRPEPAVTSHLSPHLHFGEISARQAWHAAATRATAAREFAEGVEVFLREIAWREFWANTLAINSDMADAPLQARFAAFPWSEDRSALQAWQQGVTGFPIVDAGMRQLWHIGWMHNRVRMITASFLIKDLLVRWQDGEEWFWDTQVDADLANNAGNWQWVAGCGSETAPYFRIFNPVTQAEKFDPQGAYVRRWVPELARLPDRWIHRPWQAPPLELAAAGVHLGRDYPRPLVDHSRARVRAMEAFTSIETSS